MKENKKSYRHDFKINAVMLSFQKATIDQVAKELKISSRSLLHWRKSYIINASSSPSCLGKIKLTPEEKKIYDLTQKIKKINIEFEIIKSAQDHLSKGQQCIFQFIAKNEHKYSSYLMCKILGINLGSYNKWKNEFVSEKQKWRMILKEEIKSIFIHSQNRYGSRRIAVELQKSGYQLSNSTVLRYMRELGLFVSVKKIKPEASTTLTNQSDFFN